jgi:hypothetical protein
MKLLRTPGRETSKPPDNSRIPSKGRTPVRLFFCLAKPECKNTTGVSRPLSTGTPDNGSDPGVAKTSISLPLFAIQQQRNFLHY